MPQTADTWLHRPRDGAPCTVVAEVAQGHDGSLGMAHAFIDAAADAHADAVKFQTHIAAAESTPLEPWRVRFSRQDATRYDYWKRMEFTPPQWVELRQHAVERGLLFLSSPFSIEATKLLKEVGVAGWKVASGEITNLALLTEMAVTGQPVLVSTGLSGFAEIDAAVALFRKHRSPLAVLQCTTQYPSPPEAIGLNVLGELRERYGAAVGLSDHSGTIYPSLAAATLGVEAIEVHFTLSRQMFGPDVAASVTSEELARLVKGVRFIEKMRAHPVDKAKVAEAAAASRRIFLKSVVLREALPAGTRLEPGHLTAKKPGTGIPASRLEELVGRRLARAVEPDIPLQDRDLE